MIKHSFFLTEKQQEALLIEAKSIGVDNIPDFIDKAIHLAKLFANAISHNCEFVLIDKQAQVLENKQEGKIAIIGSKNSVVFATEQINRSLDLDKKIKESNNFSLPVDDLPC